MFRFLLLFFYLNMYSQEQTKVNIIVKNKKGLLQNVHIKNMSNNEFYVTNEFGEFEIYTKESDSLYFSHLGMKPLIIVVSGDHIKRKQINIFLKELSFVLDEIVITKSKIDAYSLGIISYKPKKMSNAERKLKTAGEFKAVHLLSILGGTLELDPIINGVSGRTKKLKKHLEIEKKNKIYSFLENYFGEYLKKDLNISNEHLEQFLVYLTENKGFIDFIERIDVSKNNTIKFYLCDTWIRFKNTNKINDKLQ